MGRSRITDTSAKTLRRVVAVLLALADLADRASGRSRAVCWTVLWFLLPAEAIASEYIAASTGDPRLAGRAEPMAIGLSEDGAAHAARLARTFRALAAVLAAFLEEVCVPVEGDMALAGCGSPARHGTVALIALLDRMLAIERLDTS